MKALLILAPLVAALLAGAGTALLIGALLPRTHTATRSARYAASPESVWAAITDFERHPEWRPGLKSIQRLPDAGGFPVWRETARWGDQLPIAIEVFEPPRRMVGRIIDAGLPFGGTWTYELTPDRDGTRLRITEDGHVNPAAFRYVSRLLGHTTTMEKYLHALAARLGEQVRIEP